MPRGAGRVKFYDPGFGKVNVYSVKGSVPKIVADLLDDRVEAVGHISTPKENTDRAVDWFVHGGRDSSAVQREAINHGAGRYGAISLPAAGAWLRERIRDAVMTGQDVSIWVKGGEA